MTHYGGGLHSPAAGHCAAEPAPPARTDARACALTCRRRPAVVSKLGHCRRADDVYRQPNKPRVLHRVCRRRRLQARRAGGPTTSLAGRAGGLRAAAVPCSCQSAGAAAGRCTPPLVTLGAGRGRRSVAIGGDRVSRLTWRARDRPLAVVKAPAVAPPTPPSPESLEFPSAPAPAAGPVQRRGSAGHASRFGAGRDPRRPAAGQPKSGPGHFLSSRPRRVT